MIKTSGIRHIVMDVDGTLTDGGIYYGSRGQEWKRFDIKDGLAIKNARKCGLNFIVMTGRKSRLVERRMRELGVSCILQGVSRKETVLEKLFREKKLTKAGTAFIGDDLNDLSAMKMCGFKACPGDGCEEVKRIADYVAERGGGRGAVREIVEVILKGQELWDIFLRSASGGR